MPYRLILWPAVLLLTSFLAMAANVTWNGSGSDGNWNTGPNWNGGNAPSVGDSLIFSGSTQLYNTNNLAPRSNYSLSFGAGNFSLWGNSFTNGNGGITNLAGNNTNNIHIMLGAAQWITNAASGTTLVLAGNITNGGSANLTVGTLGDVMITGNIGSASGTTTNSLTKSGTGVLTLTGNNNFTNTVNISAGTVKIKTSTALGTGTKSVTINNGSAGQCNLHLDGSSGNLTLASTISYNCSRVPYTIYNDAGDNSINGNVTLTTGGGDTGISVDGGSLTMGGVFAPNTTGRSLLLGGAATGTTKGAINDGSGANLLLSIKKQDAGIWTLAGTNLTTGVINVNGGRLALGANAKITNSPSISVSSVATFDVSQVSGGFVLGPSKAQTLLGSGSVTGSVTVAANSYIQPGGTNTFGTLNFTNGLTFSSSGILSLDLSSASTAIGGSANDLLVVGGALTLNNSVALKLNFPGLVPVVGSPYTLVTYGTISGDPVAMLSVSTPSFPHLTATIANAGNAITVTFNLTSPGVNQLVWQGDTAVGTNWASGVSGWTNSNGAASVFYSADYVTFDDSSANSVVSLTNTVIPAGMTFSHAVNNYTLVGPGKISGATGLSKTGLGTLTLATTGTNDFTGAISLDGGTLVINRTDTNTVTQVITGNAGRLVKRGSGLVILGATNTFTGFITNEAGSLLQGSSASLSGSVINNDGTLLVNQSFVGTLPGTISGSGTLVVAGNAGAVTLTNANTFAGPTLVSNNSTLVLAGVNGYVLTNTTLYLGEGRTQAVVQIGAPYQQIPPDIQVVFKSGTISGTSAKFQVLSNSQVVGNITNAAGTFSIIENNSTGNGTFVLSNLLDNVWDQFMRSIGGGALGLTKEGTGALTLAGANIVYTGPTWVKNGSLILTNVTKITNTVTIDAGQVVLASNTLVTNTTTINGGRLVLATATSGQYVIVNNAINGGVQFSNGTAFTLGSLAGIGEIGLTNDLGSPVTLSVGVRTPDTTYDGVLSGPGSLVKVGTNILTLNGVCTYASNTLLNAGGLTLGASASISNSPVISLATNTTLNVSQVDSGLFTLNGALTPQGQMLGSSGVVEGNVLVPAGSALMPGTNGGTGSLVFSNDLTLADGSSLKLDLANVATEGSGTNDLIVVNGGLTLGGTITINFNFISGQPALNTPYNLIRYNGLLVGDPTVAFANASRYGTVFSDNSGVITVSFTAATDNNIVWQGDGVTNLWGLTLITNQWTNLSGWTAFFNGDNVLFDDSSTNFTVNVSGGLAPLSLVFNATNNYTLIGSGKITGGTGLTKSGPGKLTLSNAVDYTGATVIHAGIMQLSVPTASSMGSITNSGALVINSPATVAMTGVISGSGALTNLGSAAVTLGGANTYDGVTVLGTGTPTTLPSVLLITNSFGLGSTVGGTFVDISATNAGTGTQLQLSGDVTITGEPLTLNSLSNFNTRSCVYSVTGTNTWNGPITLTGDNACQFYAVNTNSGLIIQGNVTSAFTSSNGRLHIRGSGNGTINGTVNISTNQLFKTDPGLWVINTSGNTWGSCVHAYGTLRIGNNNALCVTAPLSLGQAGNGTTFDLAGFNQQVSGLTVAAGAPTSTQVIGNSSTSSDSILAYVGTDTNLFSGTIKDIVGSGTRKLGLTVGGGTLLLTGTNTYTGPTAVTNGALMVNLQTGTGAVTVDAGGTLGGMGAVKGILTTVAGTLSPGSNGVGQAATLTVSNLTLNSGAKLLFDFANINTAGGGVNDLINVAGSALTLNGTVTVDANLLGAYLTNGVYTLISNAASIAGSFNFVASPTLLAITPWITFGTNNTAPYNVYMTNGIVGGTLVWQGTNVAGRLWDSVTTVNWSNTVQGVADVFRLLDPVLFDDTAAPNGTVNLTTNLLPSSVTVSNTLLPYTFGGSGSLTGATMLAKQGSGTLTLSTSNNTYNGGTSVGGGTLAIGLNNTLPTNTTVNMTGTSILDLQGFSQTVSNLAFGNSVSNRIVGAPGWLAVNGGVDFISGPTATGTTNLLNLSGLGNFTYSGPTNTFRVGSTTVGSAPQLTMATMAQTNTITAMTMALGDNSLNQYTSFTNQLHWGQVNTVNVSNVNVGSRVANALMDFAPGLVSPSLTLRGLAGGNSAVANMLVGTADNNNAGQTINHVFDVTAGTIDALVANLTVGRVQQRMSTENGHFRMGAGTLMVTNMIVGQVLGANSTNGAGNGTFLLHGGTVSAGILTLADNNSLYGSTSSGTLIISNNSVFQSPSITRGHTNGTGTGTITLNGTNAVLDLLGGTIGTNGNPATYISTLNFQAGTLQNVAEVNGGTNLVKTGTGTLFLAGTNTYAGMTVVSNGMLQIDGMVSNQADVLIASGGTLVVNGTLTNGNGNFTINNGGTLVVNSRIGNGSQAIAVAGTLKGNGLINAISTTITNTGVLSPGQSIGTLSFGGELVLSPGATTIMELNNTNIIRNDRVLVNGTVILHGTLILTNLGPDLQVGDTFTLFDTNTTTLSGSFGAIQPPLLPAGLAVDTSGLTAGGSGQAFVYAKPTITQDPQPASVITGVGSNVTFTAAASGLYLSYQWYYNISTPVAGANTSQLLLTNLQSSQSGIYSLVVTNPAGSTMSAVATLVVTNHASAPSGIIITPSPTNVVEVTNAAIFSVSASGTAPLYYLWYKNSNFTAVVSTGTGVTNPAVTCANDNDYYNVIVSNTLGTASAGPVYVRVTDSNAPAFSPAVVTTNVTLLQGTNFSVTVGLAANCNLATYRWYANATNLLASQTTPTLSLANLKLNDGGIYTLIVSNQHGLSAIGTAAVVAVSYLIESPMVIVAGETFQTTVVAEPNRAYWLEARDSLTTGSWTFVLGVTNVTGPQVLQDAAAAGPYKFYRIGSARVP